MPLFKGTAIGGHIPLLKGIVIGNHIPLFKGTAIEDPLLLSKVPAIETIYACLRGTTYPDLKVHGRAEVVSRN